MAGIAFANAPVAAVPCPRVSAGRPLSLAARLDEFADAGGRSYALTCRSATSQYAELGRAVLPECDGLSDAAAAQRFIDSMGALVSAMPLCTDAA